MTASLRGRCAVVTGVSRRRGIGFAIADRLASFGADVFAQSYALYDAASAWAEAEPEHVESLLDSLRGHGTRIAHMEADFEDPEAPARVIDAAVRELGHVDVLVANHAYSVNQPLEDLVAADVDRHLVVNVRGSLLLAREFAAQHDGRRGGRVVLLTSGQHRNAMPDELAYVASKGALHQLTLSLAAALAPRGITVNTIDPGATDTGWASPALYDEVLAQIPLGRWGEPADAARLIAFLVSDDGEWITGQVLQSRGGLP